MTDVRRRYLAIDLRLIGRRSQTLLTTTCTRRPSRPNKLYRSLSALYTWEYYLMVFRLHSVDARTRIGVLIALSLSLPFAKIVSIREIVSLIAKKTLLKSHTFYSLARLSRKCNIGAFSQLQWEEKSSIGSDSKKVAPFTFFSAFSSAQRTCCHPGALLAPAIGLINIQAGC